MGYLLSLSKPATTSWLDGSEIALLVGGLVLLIGLLGEHFASAGGVWLKRFTVLVTIGCGIEFLADGGVFLFSTHLQSISDAEVIAAENDAKHADESATKANNQSITASNRAKKAYGQAKDAFDRAASAAKEAGENKLEAAYIEESLAGRRLSPQQTESVVWQVRRFSPQEVSLWFTVGDGEGESFAWDIALTLQKATWDVFTPAGSIRMAVTCPRKPHI